MGALYALLGLVVGIVIDEAIRRRMDSAGDGAKLDRNSRRRFARQLRTNTRLSRASGQFAAQDYYDR